MSYSSSETATNIHKDKIMSLMVYTKGAALVLRYSNAQPPLYVELAPLLVQFLHFITPWECIEEI
jgi:hypothetical protein